MELSQPVSAAELAEYINGNFKGPEDLKVSGLNEIHKVTNGDVTFADNRKYFQKAFSSAASLILIHEEATPPEGKGVIIIDEPFTAYNELVEWLKPGNGLPKGSYLWGEDTFIHDSAQIHPGVVIGSRVKIGQNVTIHPNTVIYDDTLIGSNVTIGANTTIGGDAFYFKKRETGHEKLISSGKVVIEKNVHIGCNCTIDKGVSRITRIGKGSILDNQVHIGHGVEMRENCLLAGQVGVGGKTLIGNNVKIWGQAGLNKDIKIADNVEILAKAGVGQSILNAGKYFGSPSGKASKKYRELSALEKLPEWIKNK